MIYNSKSFKIEQIKIRARTLTGNFLKDKSERELIILERNAKESTPILIGLAGFFGSSESFIQTRYIGYDFLKVLNGIVKKKNIGSFIIALPDTMTSYYGNQYLNSIAVGDYEDFITKDVVRTLQKKYGKRRMGIFGKSSGGFGSYTLSVRHPEIFEGFIDLSGDSGFEYCYMKDFPIALTQISQRGISGFINYFRKKPHPDNSDLTTMSTIAMSAFYSPDKKSELRVTLPFDLTTFKVDQGVWEKWLKFDPMRNAETYLDSLRNEKVILQVGRKDEFFINVGMKGLSKILKKNKIQHDYRVYDEGHFGIEYLYEESLPSLINHLSE